MQIIGFRWKINGSKEWEPLIIGKTDGIVEKIDILNQHILLSIGEKFCIGHYLGGIYKACPENRRLHAGRYCENCSKTDDFFLC